MSKGTFEVDVSALDLKSDQLDRLEVKINAIVADAIAAQGFKNPPTRIWGGHGTRGIRYIPDGGLLGRTAIKPYGVVIQEAIKSGDATRMKAVLSETKDYLKHADEVGAALKQLKSAIKKQK